MQNDKAAESINKRIDDMFQNFQNNTTATTSPNICQTDIPDTQELVSQRNLLAGSGPFPVHAVINSMKDTKSCKEQSQHSFCFSNQLVTPMPTVDMLSMIPVQEVFDKSISDIAFEIKRDGKNSFSLIEESSGKVLSFPDGIPEGLIPQEIILNHNLPVKSRKKTKQTLKRKYKQNDLGATSQRKNPALNQTGNVSDPKGYKKRSPTSNTSSNTFKTMFSNENRSLTSVCFNSDVVVLSDDSDCVELLSSDEDSGKLRSLKTSDDLLAQDAGHFKGFLKKNLIENNIVSQAQPEILEHCRLTHPRDKSAMMFAKQKTNSEINPDLSNLYNSKLDNLENYTEISDSESSELPESSLSPGMLSDTNALQFDATSDVDVQIIIQKTPERSTPEKNEKQCLTKKCMEAECVETEPIALSCIESIENNGLVLCNMIEHKKTSLEYLSKEDSDSFESLSLLSSYSDSPNILNTSSKHFFENITSNKHLPSNSIQNLHFVSSSNLATSNDHHKSLNESQTNDIETSSDSITNSLFINNDFSQISQLSSNSSNDQIKTNQEIFLNSNEISTIYNSDNDRTETVVNIPMSCCSKQMSCCCNQMPCCCNQMSSEDFTLVDRLTDVSDIITSTIDKKDDFLKNQVSNDQDQYSGDKVKELSGDKVCSSYDQSHVDNKNILVNFSQQNIDKSSDSTPINDEQNNTNSSYQFSTSCELNVLALSSDSISNNDSSYQFSISNNEQSFTEKFISKNNDNKKKFEKVKKPKKKHQQVLQRNTAFFLNEFDCSKSKKNAEGISKNTYEIKLTTNEQKIEIMNNKSPQYNEPTTSCALKNEEIVNICSQYIEPITKEHPYKNEVIKKDFSQYNEPMIKEFTQKNELINEECTQNIANVAFLESSCESSHLFDTPCTSTEESSYENFISYNFKKELTQVACSEKEFNSSQDNFLRGASWSPDGQLILTNSNDNLLRVFKIPDDIMEHNSNHMDMQPIVRIAGGETVYSTDWYPYMNTANPDSCLFLSSSRDHPVHLWDAVTGEVRCSYRAFDQMDELTSALSVSFNADGSKIYAGFNNKIRIFESSRPGRDCIEMSTVGKKGTRKKIRMQHGIVSCISFPKQYNGCYALGSFSKTVGLYDCNTDENICVMHGHRGGITQVQFTSDGCYLFSGGRKDNEIFCWDMRSTVVPVFKLSREVNTNQRIQFDIDRSDSYVFTGNTTQSIGFHNLHYVFENLSDEECCFKPTRMFQAHEDVVNGVSLHPSLPLLVSTSGQRHFFVDDSSDSDSSGDTPTARKIDNSMRIWII